MLYCTECLLPSTKPHITFGDEGVCTACSAHRQKNNSEVGIDWSARAEEFDTLLESVHSQRAPVYDVVVPVSGGKDSIAQVHRVLGHGLRILAVNVDYGIKTDIGRRNLACIPRMGASLVTFRPEEELQRRLIRIGFEDFGDPDLLSHTMLHGFPVRLAVALRVPLVMLGENSAFEYGGSEELAAQSGISRDWFSRYAANDGRDARFISEKYDIPMADLIAYDYPDELDSSGTRAVWTSHFFHWESESNLEIAQRYGFEQLAEPAEGTYRRFVGIDEKINRIHQYMKVLKFGYGRATDHACEDIRNGRLTRDEAKALIYRHDLTPLSDGFALDFCAWLGYHKAEFDAILEQYRNTTIWAKSDAGDWVIPGHLDNERGNRV